MCVHLWRVTLCDANLHLICVHLWRVQSISTSPTSAMSIFPELLQLVRHRLIRLLAALLASAPLALVLADARPPALLALAPFALVLADARPPALLAYAPPALVRADARPPELLTLAPDALVRAGARAPAQLAYAPFALVRADARPPALFASAPFALVPTDTARLVVRGATRCVGIFKLCDVYLLNRKSRRGYETRRDSS
jgi:hypothetical protein